MLKFFSRFFFFLQRCLKTFLSNQLLRREGLTEEVFLRIKPGGEVLLSQRISAKFSCPMYLANFPFDSQLCYVEIESCEFSNESTLTK